MVGDGYRPAGPARGFSGMGGASSGGNTERWLVVTVNRPPQEIQTEAGLPGPLAEFGDGVEVRIQPAPGDKGTEISARPRGPVPSGEDPRKAVRERLRQTKQILETGEVLSPDRPPTTKSTPGGKLLGSRRCLTPALDWAAHLTRTVWTASSFARLSPPGGGT